MSRSAVLAIVFATSVWSYLFGWWLNTDFACQQAETVRRIGVILPVSNPSSNASAGVASDPFAKVSY